ncbi:MAG: S-layer homology domain-containing protein [Candidatus Limnocylindria bacterium]
MADDVADAASAAGATVAKAYSPTATWGNVRNAVDGANVVVYFGHGNGYPNPYTIGHQYTDRVNGWGVNRTTTNGDSDSWSSTMVYCGEKALLGTLTSSDGAAQRQYCTGKVNPAPGFTMVYAQAHYAPGFGERYVESTPLTTLAEAQQRVRNYSRPVFGLGGSAFYATAYGDADEIVTRLLTDGRTHGDLFRSGRGFSAGTLTTMAHPDVPGTAVWVQRTSISGLHFGDPDYWYAFAGNPDTTAAEGFVPLPFSDIASSPFRNDIVWLAETGITGGCGNGRFCPDQAVTREQMASFLVRALDLPATGTDYFTDDGSSIHHADINRLAASGITGGCDDGRFCPRNVVTREQMASFLVRALDLPATGTDYFTDDGSSIHEADINRLAASGITGGCGGSRFCPAAGVTRGQMAAFLRRGLS